MKFMSKKESERHLERRKQEQENTNKQQIVEIQLLRMPAEVSWPRYLTFFAVSLATCLTGSQVLHSYNRPNLVRMFCYVYFMIHERRR